MHKLIQNTVPAYIDIPSRNSDMD